MTILATSPDGELRLREMKNGKGVVELFYHDKWNWCVFRSAPMEKAWEVYDNQVRHHQ